MENAAHRSRWAEGLLKPPAALHELCLTFADPEDIENPIMERHRPLDHAFSLGNWWWHIT
jgi:hypothetical protein